MLTFSQTLVKSTFCNASRLLACCPNTTCTRQGEGFVFKKFLLAFFCHEKCKWQPKENDRVTLRFIGHFKKVHRDIHAVCYLTQDRWKNNRERLSAERFGIFHLNCNVHKQAFIDLRQVGLIGACIACDVFFLRPDAWQILLHSPFSVMLLQVLRHLGWILKKRFPCKNKADSVVSINACWC